MPSVVPDPGSTATSYVLGVDEDTESLSIVPPTAYGAAAATTAGERALLFLDASFDNIELLANTPDTSRAVSSRLFRCAHHARRRPAGRALRRHGDSAGHSALRVLHRRRWRRWRRRPRLRRVLRRDDRPVPRCDDDHHHGHYRHHRTGAEHDGRAGHDDDDPRRCHRVAGRTLVDSLSRRRQCRRCGRRRRMVSPTPSTQPSSTTTRSPCTSPSFPRRSSGSRPAPRRLRPPAPTTP